MSQSKTCKVCGEIAVHRTYRDRCIPCQNQQQRERRTNHYNPRKARHYKLRAAYGLSLAEYDQMVTAQGGTCAICRQPETALDGKGNIKALAVDHDHNSGRVRALLCHRCNVGLGTMADDPSRLRAGAEYLESFAVA